MWFDIVHCIVIVMMVFLYLYVLHACWECFVACD